MRRSEHQAFRSPEDAAAEAEADGEEAAGEAGVPCNTGACDMAGSVGCVPGYSTGACDMAGYAGLCARLCDTRGLTCEAAVQPCLTTGLCDTLAA